MAKGITIFLAALLMAGLILAINPALASSAKNPPLEAALAWLTLIDGGKYEASWDEAAGYFQNAISKAKWKQTLQAVRKPLGKLISRAKKSSTTKKALPGAPDATYTIFQFSTSFSQKKSALETVTVVLDKGSWRAVGYLIK